MLAAIPASFLHRPAYMGQSTQLQFTPCMPKTAPYIGEHVAPQNPSLALLLSQQPSSGDEPRSLPALQQSILPAVAEPHAYLALHCPR